MDLVAPQYQIKDYPFPVNISFSIKAVLTLSWPPVIQG